MTVEINLIPDSRRRVRTHRNRIKCWVAAGSVYGFILLIGCGLLRTVWATGDPDTLSRSNQTQARMQAIHDSISDIHSQLGAYEQTLTANRDLIEHPDWGLLLGLLSKTLGDNLVLREFEIQRIAMSDANSSQQVDEEASGHGDTAFRLTIKGMGRTQAAVSQFALRLEKTGLFDGVKLLDTSLAPFLSGKAVAFRLECKLAGGAS